MALSIRQLNTKDPGFEDELDLLISWEEVEDRELEEVVRNILNHVKEHGDEAVVEFTNRFDRLKVSSLADLEVDAGRLEQACNNLEEETRFALKSAANRIRSYHENQKATSWSYEDPLGITLGQQVTALERVGIYVPGGKASYPSSVLMNALPAKVAGVDEIIMVVPAPDGEISELVLAAAHVAEVDRVFTIGGAQAVAALAYGTECFPAVDKIVGPGNRFVASAKRQVFGRVGIDMIAGPSEILVLCDGKTDPDWIAMDLFSQAEHDEMAQSILISDDSEFLRNVLESMERLLGEMPRADIIRTSLENRAAFILVESIEAGIDIVNIIAPEHLEMSVEDADEYLSSIRHAGAIFLGRYTPEAVGDYCAGPNHVLPTSGTARFSSPLGVYDFQKRSSVINCNPGGASELGELASVLARGEGLEAHARSAAYRIKKK